VPTKSYRLPTEWIAPNTTIVNVSSFKNVDEAALLQIPGVVYVPRVGKVTVAMLERNLMRLFDQFHLQPPQQQTTTRGNIKQQEKPNDESWYGHPLNLYTALTVTLLLAMQFMQQQQRK
jgi:methylenetetrahydrofolate dehydrogenase (NAD+)